MGTRTVAGRVVRMLEVHAEIGMKNIAENVQLTGFVFENFDGSVLNIAATTYVGIRPGMNLIFEITDSQLLQGCLMSVKPLEFFNKIPTLSVVEAYFTSGPFYQKVSKKEFERVIAPAAGSSVCYLIYYLYRNIGYFIGRPEFAGILHVFESRIRKKAVELSFANHNAVFALESLLPDQHGYTWADLTTIWKSLQREYVRYNYLTAEISANPWLFFRGRLHRKPRKMTFKFIDAIAANLGFSAYDPMRLDLGISLGVLDVLHNGSKSYAYKVLDAYELASWDGGHCFTDMGAKMPVEYRPRWAKGVPAGQPLDAFPIRYVPKIQDNLGAKSQFDLNLIVNHLLSNTSEFVKVETVNGRNLCYDASLLKAEIIVAEVLRKKLLGDYTLEERLRMSRLNFDVDACEKRFVEIFKDRGFDANDLQIKAARNVFKHDVSVITGGPGSGKSTVLGAVVKIMNEHGHTPFVLTTTGKALKNAVQNILDSCGMDVKYKDLTIARLRAHSKLSFSFDKEFDGCGREDFTVENCSGKFVLVDESSMVSLQDVAIVLTLMKYCHVIFIGDVYQLPPIAPGQFFADLFKLGDMIPVVELTGNYRVSAGADANKLLGTFDLIRQATIGNRQVSLEDFKFAEGVLESCFGSVNAKMVEKIVDDFEKNVKKYGIENVICLAPVHKGLGGDKNLNKVLQARMNPAIEFKNAQHSMVAGHQCFKQRGTEIPELKAYGWSGAADLQEIDNEGESYSNRYFMRVGDRVTIVRNSECKPVSDADAPGTTVTVANGDTGELTGYYINMDDKAYNYVTIRLDDGVEVVIPRENFDDIALGYASTVHKAQGSGYKCVMIVYDNRMANCKGFNSRNMLYTGMTRTKEFCSLYGSERSFQLGLDTPQAERNSMLAARILGQV